MKFEEGDVVLILCNNTIGRVEKIHNWQPLHDVVGLDGFKYKNQMAGELVLIKDLNRVTLERLTHWVLTPFLFKQKGRKCQQEEGTGESSREAWKSENRVGGG
jgi:hypothetical protein